MTPSSMCALEASSASLCSRTDLLQSVLTKVVRPTEAQCESRHSPFELRAGELHREWAGQRRTSARGTTHHQAKLNALLDILLSADNLLECQQLLVLSRSRAQSRGVGHSIALKSMSWERRMCIPILRLTRQKDLRETGDWTYGGHHERQLLWGGEGP